MLKRVIIENYRSCLRTSFDCHPNLSVLIGPNSSGKTNILQAIMLLNKMALQEEYSSHQQEAVTVSSRIRGHFSSRQAETQLLASVDVYTDESNNDVLTASRQKWVITRPNGKRVSLRIPAFAAARFGEEWMWPRYYHARGKPLYRDLFWARDKTPTWAISAVEQASKFYKGIRYYGASQFTNPGACPVSFEIEREGERRRPFRPQGHAKILYHMYEAQSGKAHGRYEQFFSIVGPKGLRLIDDLTFKEVRTSSIDYSVRVGGKLEVRRRYKLLVIPRFRIGTHNLSPNQLSEGTFKTLALLFYIIMHDSTALLIEEPEVCIHHGLLSSILELIKSYSRHKQMIVSTHSDYVLDHVSPDNVFRVTHERKSGTIVRHISRTMSAREFAGLRRYLEAEGNLGEYWREGGLGDRR